jgi:hypothetical protein
MIEMKLEGGRELEAKLLNIERKMGKKIVRQAVREGGKEILTAAKSNARGIVGGRMGAVIAKALQVRAMKKQRQGQYAVQVRHSEKYNDELVDTTKDGRRHYVPNAIEYGHAAPGDARGAKTVPARPYLRPAFDSRKGRATKLVHKTLIDGVEREWKSGR